MQIVVSSPGLFGTACAGSLFLGIVEVFAIENYHVAPIRTFALTLIICVTAPAVLWFASTVTKIEGNLIIRQAFFGCGRKRVLDLNQIEEFTAKIDSTGNLRSFRIKDINGDSMEFVSQQRNFAAAYHYFKTRLRAPIPDQDQ